MTVTQHNIGRLRAYEEPNGSFATDHTGTLGDYIDVPARVGTVTLRLNQDELETGKLQQHIDGRSESELGPKRWTMDMTLNLATFDTRASDGVAATQGALGRLLKIALGGQNLGTGDTVNDASPAVSSFDVTTSARWAAGGCIAAATGSGGELEMREIEGLSGSTLTTKLAFTGAPANSSTLYNTATYYMETGDGDVATAAQFIAEGLESNNRWLLMGGQCTGLSLGLDIGSIPSVTFSWSGVDWDYGDGTDTAADLTGAIAFATYSDDSHLILNDSEFHVQTVGTATLAAAMHASSISYSPNLSWVDQVTPAGTNGVAAKIRTHAPPVCSGSFVLPYEDTTWKDAWEAKTKKAVWLQVGMSATGGGCLISCPTTQIVNWDPFEDQNGIASQRVDWVARLDEDIGSVTTDIGLSAFKMHFA